MSDRPNPFDWPDAGGRPRCTCQPGMYSALCAVHFEIAEAPRVKVEPPPFLDPAIVCGCPFPGGDDCLVTQDALRDTQTPLVEDSAASPTLEEIHETLDRVIRDQLSPEPSQFEGPEDGSLRCQGSRIMRQGSPCVFCQAEFTEDEAELIDGYLYAPAHRMDHSVIGIVEEIADAYVAYSEPDPIDEEAKRMGYAGKDSYFRERGAVTKGYADQNTGLKKLLDAIKAEPEPYSAHLLHMDLSTAHFLAPRFSVTCHHPIDHPDWKTYPPEEGTCWFWTKWLKYDAELLSAEGWPQDPKFPLPVKPDDVTVDWHIVYEEPTT